MQKRGGRLRGLFADNIWKCDCNPRLPAEHFRVKKDGKNHGRWFYTCQQQDLKRCGFFLWDDDAKPREAAAVMSNSTSEVQRSSHSHRDNREQQTRQPQQDQDGWKADRQGKGLFSPNPAIKQELNATPSPTLSPQDTPYSGSKRNLANTGFEHGDDNWGLEDDDDDDDEDLLRVANSYETPHKTQKTGVYATPATGKKSPRKLPWLEQAISPPASSHPKSRHEIFATPTKPPPSKIIDQQPNSPTPQSKFKDALINPSDSTSPLTKEVLTHLSTISLPPEKLSTLRTILSRYDLKAQGVSKGRDISRLALKAKEAKIVELQSRIVRLEAEREVDRGVIGKLRWEREVLKIGEGEEDNEEEEEEEL